MTTTTTFSYTVYFYLVGGSRGPFTSLEEAVAYGKRACFSFYVCDDDTGSRVYSWEPIGGP